MLSFVQSWFAPTANPIGVDFGSDALRMAQVEQVGENDYKLVAAARADVPSHVRTNAQARLAFFQESVRDLWSQANFRGRRAVLSLPASVMSIQHLRLAKMDDDAIRKALPWEARGKLPYDPSHALLRHLVAGEVHHDGEQKNEVILMAAAREWVNQFLAAAARAKLDVVGMNVEPQALVDCFSHIYRRKTDSEMTTCFVDIGCGASRVVIARNGHILFARIVPIGGDHFTRAVAAAMKSGFDDAKVLRIKACEQSPEASQPLNGGSRDDRGPSEASPGAPAGQAASTNESSAIPPDACVEPLERLVEELALCRRYHEATFPGSPVDRLVFVGGEARHRDLCAAVAKKLELAAQVGDPMVRLARTCEIGPESGLDRRLPQPDWAVAIGLSMGPVAVPATVEAK